MREWDESWAVRRRRHNDRAMVRAVVIVALLLVGAEISGMLGYW